MSYIVTARWRPRAGETAAIEAILRERAAAIRDEPGNVSFTVHRARDDTRDIFLHEVYKSEEAFKAHREMQHFKTFVLQRAVPLLEQREGLGQPVVVSHLGPHARVGDPCLASLGDPDGRRLGRRQFRVVRRDRCLDLRQQLVVAEQSGPHHVGHPRAGGVDRGRHREQVTSRARRAGAAGGSPRR